jgi:hypothetical protein
MKLGRNASDTLQCSPRHIGEKLGKIQVFSNGINSSKRVMR